MPDIKPVTIDKESAAAQGHAYDFAFLRQQAIRLIQQMSGDEWTDYNLHDPGVTIVEQLCYAITDLAYRTGFPIEDLLADKRGKINFNKNSFHHREEILFSPPVTINDYRKILIDRVEEIDNVWLEPLFPKYATEGVKGVYRALIQVKKETAKKLLSNTAEGNRVMDAVQSVFVSERGLCEDLQRQVVVLQPVEVQINADVMIKDDAQPEQVLAHIYHAIESLLSARVHYFTEEELLAEGYQIEDIYKGPRLSKGIIPDSELKPRKTAIDNIELTRAISNVDGVLQVKRIVIQGLDQTVHNRPLKIGNFSFPFIDTSRASGIKLFTSKYQVQINQAVFDNLYLKLDAAHNRQFISNFYEAHDYLLTGKFRNPEQYFSLQNSFPILYGIGSEGLPVGDRSETRKAQVKQLKGYLLLFEQILANYLSQLAHVEDSFSAAVPLSNQTEDYYQPLYDVPDVRSLLKSFTQDSPDQTDSEWDAFVKNVNNGYMQALMGLADSDTKYKKRKTAQIDHLLARFNEVLVDYPVKLFRQIYKPDTDEGRFSDEMKWKCYYLSNIANIQRGGMRGFNYLNGPNHSTSFDFEKKIRLLLYLKSLESEKKLTAVLNDNHFKQETASRKSSSQAEQLQDGTSTDLSMIFLSRKDTDELISKNQIKRPNDLSDNQFGFANRSSLIFSSAIDYRNYRIVPDLLYGDEKDYLLLFRNEDNTGWDVISRHDDENSAVATLKKLVRHFRHLSVESEGLYIIEHILLRPSLDSQSFGFRFLGLENEELFTSREWVNFADRDKVIKDLLDANKYKDRTKLTSALLKHCMVNPYSSEAATDAFNKPIDCINVPVNAETRAQRFEMTVKGEDGKPVDESFFNFQITVVLPAWPARFQDKNFRGFIKDMIVLNVPANVKVNLRWLAPTKMAAFEDDFLQWRESFKTDHDKRAQLALKLLSFLLKK